MTSPIIQKAVFDETLPQIPELLDAPKMTSVFERELGCRVEDCQIVRAKLRPGRNCLVTYRLKLIDPETGETRKRLLSLLAFGQNESRERFNLAQRQPLVSTTIGKPVIHLPELDAVAWAFPNDRKLPGLPAIADSETLKKHLPEVIANSFGKEGKIAALESEVVSYAAERSCTVCVKLELTLRERRRPARWEKSGEASFAQTLFGKTYRPGEGATVWQVMQWLYRHKPGLIPQPLGFQPEINALWQLALAGNTLDVFDGEELHAWLAKAGAAVAELHRLPIPDLPLREAVTPLEALVVAERLLVYAVPACQPKLQLLLERLRETFGMLETRPAAILHGDLHLKNFLATGETVVLIDWDNVCVGDPMQELGSFAASLHYRELLERTAAANQIDTFVEAYFAASEVESSALIWHSAAALIYERAQRHIIRLSADAPRVVEELTELSFRLTRKL